MVLFTDAKSSCTYPGCGAVLVIGLRGTSEPGEPGVLNGWVWPNGTLEDDNVPIHDHVTGGGQR